MPQNISQLQVRTQLPIGQVGDVYGDSDQFIEDNAPHPAGAAKQKNQISIDTASDDTKYSYVVEGETIEFTSGTGATKNSIATGLKDAHNANIIARGVAVPSVDASDNLDLESGRKRQSFDISTSDANLTLTETQAASDESDVPVGRAVWWDGNGNVTLTQQGALRDYKITVNTVSNNADYTLTFSLDGALHRVVFTSDADATEDEIVQGLETEIDNLSLDNVDGTSDTAANPSEVHLKASRLDGNDLELTDASDNLDVSLETAGDQFEAVFAGMSRKTYDVESDEPYETDNGPFGARQNVQFLRRGLMVVDASGATKFGEAFIGTDSDEEGQIFDSQNASGTRIPAPKSALTFHDSNILEVKVGY